MPTPSFIIVATGTFLLLCIGSFPAFAAPPPPQEETTQAPTEQPEKQDQTAPSEQPIPGNQVRPNVEISVSTQGNERLYSVNRINVKTGQTVLLTFKNNATQQSGLRHDWVLVTPGKQSLVVELGAGAGISSGDPEYDPAVLAGTSLLPPGQTSTILFEAPTKPGIYPFLSTATGDWPSMRGELVVTEIRTVN